MDTPVLTPDLLRANNPGLTDFGSGNVLALASQCLRCAKKPTPCTVCAEFCPANALETKAAGRPIIGRDCIKCAACVGVCPLNALAGTTKTLQQVARLALQASLHVEHLALGCERTAGLLRLEAETEDAEEAQRLLALVQNAQANECLLAVPCLGMLTKELWFAVLNEIGPSKLRQVSVFLPPNQCAQCPVNAKGNVEEQFAAAIAHAEGWAHQEVGLVLQADDLPTIRKANVRAYLAGTAEVDRRGMFTGFVQELRQSWEDNAQAGNKAADELRLQRERKKSFERTRLAADLRKKRPQGRSPIEVPTRYILVEALGRNDAHAHDLALTVSTTDAALCTLCGACIEACAVRARSLVEEAPAEGVPAEGGAANEAPDAAGDASANEAPDAADGQADTLSRVVTNDLYCVACSACLQVCPAGACSFTEVYGSSLLLDDTDEEDGKDGDVTP
ncbi:MAG: 4Fe-4S dicluster domain-containing protein [Coriobacteriales bacterium]|jgi:ferredoxin|nr:4Fe-4S dicluster domain-containing protein [Coriobacteriales bacterium]